MSAGPVELIAADGPAEWTALVEGDPRATPFLAWTFLERLARRCDWTFRPLIVRRDGEAVGVVPVMTNGHMRMMPALPIPYVGPLVPAELVRDTLLTLRRWQMRSGVVLVRGGFSSLQSAPPSGLGPGFSVRVEPTYVLDIAHGDSELYSRGMSADRRANLRRAARRGVTTRPSVPGEARELLPLVVGSSYARHGDAPSRALPAIAAFIDDELTRASPLIAETVLVRDEAVGMLVGVRGATSAFGWIGGVTRAALPTSANSVAYDAVVRRAISAGVQRFDFVGYVDEGVARFKRSFGAEEESCWQVTSSLVPGRVTGIVNGLRAADWPRRLRPAPPARTPGDQHPVG